ncbi:hypothetical protein [Agromyces sp. Leaf222]|uniref:hypothetical protein n=1 Tax=Agromyces sp. Leaf222 TaxID=1735688 RepID=UPI0006FF1518|nr:hypothetical protein [Agromyces sp. Leaf222]KQM82607.1 hypothetical protein ASE68_04340 [Agromyces sp. Leaf222]
MNVQHLLDEERERENRSTQRRMPRHRVALLIGAVGAVIIIGTGSALTAAAVASITEYDELNAAAEASSPVITPTELAPSAILPAETATETAAEAPAAAAAEETVVDEAATEDPVEPAPGGITTILGHTVYDETTDLALIPRPSPEFIEEWALDFDTIVMQSHLDAVCMADKGFQAAFLPIWDTWESGDTMEAVGALDAFNDSRNPEWQLAMWGADDQPLGEDYDWKQAGCHGASVHDTGMDDAH